MKWYSLPVNNLGIFPTPSSKAVWISGWNVVEHMDELTIGLSLCQLLNKPSKTVHGVNPVVIEPTEKMFFLLFIGDEI